MNGDDGRCGGRRPCHFQGRSGGSTGALRVNLAPRRDRRPGASGQRCTAVSRDCPSSVERRAPSWPAAVRPNPHNDAFTPCSLLMPIRGMSVHRAVSGRGRSGRCARQRRNRLTGNPCIMARVAPVFLHATGSTTQFPMYQRGRFSLIPALFVPAAKRSGRYRFQANAIAPEPTARLSHPRDSDACRPVAIALRDKDHSRRDTPSARDRQEIVE